jgi:hypothetical protein
MSEDPTDWDTIARAKLKRVLGDKAGRSAMDEALHALALPKVRSAADLRRLADHLSTKGGFAGAVGGLLSVHAAMYGYADTLKDAS